MGTLEVMVPNSGHPGQACEDLGGGAVVEDIRNLGHWLLSELA